METVADVFTDILFLENHSPYFFQKWLKLLKDKTLEIIRKFGRTEVKVGLRLAESLDSLAPRKE